MEILIFCKCQAAKNYNNCKLFPIHIHKCYFNLLFLLFLSLSIPKNVCIIVFQVTDYEFVIKFSKFKMTNPIQQTKFWKIYKMADSRWWTKVWEIFIFCGKKLIYKVFWVAYYRFANFETADSSEKSHEIQLKSILYESTYSIVVSILNWLSSIHACDNRFLQTIELFSTVFLGLHQIVICITFNSLYQSYVKQFFFFKLIFAVLVLFSAVFIRTI